MHIPATRFFWWTLFLKISKLKQGFLFPKTSKLKQGLEKGSLQFYCPLYRENRELCPWESLTMKGVSDRGWRDTMLKAQMSGWALMGGCMSTTSESSDTRPWYPAEGCTRSNLGVAGGRGETNVKKEIKG